MDASEKTLCLVKQKLALEYSGLNLKWMAMTKEQLIENAAEIAAVKDIYASFTTSDSETLRCLLNQEQALEAVCGHFLARRSRDLHVEVYDAIWDLTDGALEQASANQFAEGVTMC